MENWRKLSQNYHQILLLNKSSGQENPVWDWQKLVLIAEWSYFWVVLIAEFYDIFTGTLSSALQINQSQQRPMFSNTRPSAVSLQVRQSLIQQQKVKQIREQKQQEQQRLMLQRRQFASQQQNFPGQRFTPVSTQTIHSQVRAHIFLISPQRHTLWVFIRSPSMRSL